MLSRFLVLLVFCASAQPIRFERHEIRNLGKERITSGVIEARVTDWNGDGRPDLLVVEAASLSWWENR
jgi:hypothetical protein